MEQKSFSFEQMKQEVHHKVDKYLLKLFNIWNDIGIKDEQQEARSNVVLLHISNLLDEMVSEEETLKSRLLENIGKFSSKLYDLCTELKLPICETECSQSIVDKEKALRTRYDSLTKDKSNRMSRLKQLVETDKRLSSQLDSMPFVLPTSTTIPSHSLLDSFEKHVRRLESDKDARLQTFLNAKKSVVKLARELDYEPLTSFERQALGEDSNNLVLSSDILRSMKGFQEKLEEKREEHVKTASRLRAEVQALWSELDMSNKEQSASSTLFFGIGSKTIKALQEELNKLTTNKSQKAQREVESAQLELTSLWNKCFYSQEQRDVKKHLTDADYTKVDRQALQQELQVLRAYHESHHELLDKVSNYQQVFDDFVAVERKASQPTRFFNRNCNLLKEEKARSRLSKELAQAEQDALSCIGDWEKKTGNFFLINGSRFKDYVKLKKQEFKAEKDDNKIRHLENKVKQSDGFSYSESKATPLKRRFAGMTPTKLAAKLLKFEGDGARSAPLSNIYNMTSNTPTTGGSRAGGSLGITSESVIITRHKLLSSPCHTPATLKSSSKGHQGSLFHCIPSSASTRTPRNAQTPGKSVHRQPVSSCDHNKRNARHLAPFSQRPQSAEPIKQEENLSGIEALNCDVTLQSPGKKAEDLFSYTTITSNLLPSKFSGKENIVLEQCEISSIGSASYEEFTRGLTLSGKSYISSSVVTLQKAKPECL